MPQGFRFPYNGEVWTPTTITPLGPRDYAVFARLRTGIEISGLASPLSAAAADVRAKYPATTSPGLGFEAIPIRESFIDQQDKTVAALTGVAAFFLLLASFNVASLVLARNVGRRKDLEIRAALGATRWVLARQGLIEMLLLSLASAAAAVFVAAEAAPWVTALVPRVLSQELNLRVQYSFGEISLLCAALAVLAGMIAGALPLAANASIVASGVTRMGSRASRSRRERRAMDTFVVFQFAIALALIAGAGLMIRNFAKLTRQDLGVDAQHLLSIRVSTENARFASPEAKRLLVANLISAANSTAGVLASGVTTANPFGGGTWTAPIEVEGQNSSAGRASEWVNHRLITPRLFDSMGIRVLAGRAFTEDDREGKPGVAIVSQRMAKKFWPQGEALGKRVRVNRPGRVWLTVVGIVSDVQDSVAFGAAGTDAEQHATTWYLPYRQNADSAAAQDVIVMVRSAGSPTAVAHAVEQIIHAADPELVLFDASNMREFYLLSLSQQHTGSILISGLAGFGLLLGALGIYGTLSFNVAERTREVGIRRALGCTQAQVLLLTLKDGMRLALISCLIGLAGAWALGRVLASQLSEVSPADPAALLGSAATMLAVTAFAIYLPSRRAAALDPIVALRND
jgi:putative ABC transport system permease protein